MPMSRFRGGLQSHRKAGNSRVLRARFGPSLEVKLSVTGLENYREAESGKVWGAEKVALSVPKALEIHRQSTAFAVSLASN